MEEGYENAMKEYHKKQVTQLNTLVTMLIGQLSKGDRQKIMTICTIDVHSRDVVAKMIAQKVCVHGSTRSCAGRWRGGYKSNRPTADHSGHCLSLWEIRDYIYLHNVCGKEAERHRKPAVLFCVMTMRHQGAGACCIHTRSERMALCPVAKARVGG